MRQNDPDHSRWAVMHDTSTMTGHGVTTRWTALKKHVLAAKTFRMHGICQVRFTKMKSPIEWFSHHQLLRPADV